MEDEGNEEGVIYDPEVGDLVKFWDLKADKIVGPYEVTAKPSPMKVEIRTETGKQTIRKKNVVRIIPNITQGDLIWYRHPVTNKILGPLLVVGVNIDEVIIKEKGAYDVLPKGWITNINQPPEDKSGKDQGARSVESPKKRPAETRGEQEEGERNSKRRRELRPNPKRIPTREPPIIPDSADESMSTVAEDNYTVYEPRSSELTQEDQQFTLETSGSTIEQNREIYRRRDSAENITGQADTSEKGGEEGRGGSQSSTGLYSSDEDDSEDPLPEDENIPEHFFSEGEAEEVPDNIFCDRTHVAENKDNFAFFLSAD